ncbi:MAG TPA: PAS domain-containing protein, partial [Chitinophagaceae bacterium]|nr:PAS domain-containing protein [Chitinophagaceae bacterium]
CRNMLIYMDPFLQKKIFQKFHFAINNGGFIFLGPSENISSLKDVVEEVDRKWKIYKCISKERVSQDLFLGPSDRANFVVPAATKSKNALNNLPEIFNETLLEEQSFAGIYIDKDCDVKQAIGNFKSFINFPDGSFNFNLLKLVPLDLSIALNSAIRKASKEDQRVVHKKVKVQEGSKYRYVDIIVKPYLNHKNYLQPFIFVILNETKPEELAAFKGQGLPVEDATGRIAELEKELFDTKENLQALLEEVESANEELHSSNEEIVSANEELQSTNEELQSLNEELHTVNAEHQLKIKELLELNDDLDNVFNNTDIGQILIDKKLIIRKFTPVATQQVNLIETDIGRSIADISTNFKNLHFINEIKEVMATGKKIEKHIVMNDEASYLMRMAPFLKHNGSIDGVVINFIDISEINKLNTILGAVFDSSITGILAKKAIRKSDGEIVDFEYIAANKAAENLLGLQPNSVVGKTLLSLFPSTNKEYLNAYKAIVKTGEAKNFRIYHESNNRWFEVVSVKMMDGLLTSFADITDKKKSEDLLQKGYVELQDTTNQLANMNIELEKSNFDLMQFASVASHDLKEPLRKIQAYGNLFQDRVKHKLEEGENNYLEKVINSAKRMQVMIDDILTLSKLSNNEIKRESADLNRIVHSIIDDLEISIKEKKVNIEIEPLPVISAVPGQMHQLFQNLIINGLKFNESNHPQIRIYQKPVSPEMKVQYGIGPDYVCLAVKDNGIGIEPQYKEKVFGIFQRLNGSNFQGTGIGLAICKKIVENHNGIIAIETALGKGSEFLIMLPG